MPDGEPRAGFVFYPGGRVDPAAYARLMRRLSDGGIFAVIVPMPQELAALGIGRADNVIAAYSQIDIWIIGGHSLGGAMAAAYAKNNSDAIDGVAFLASDPSDFTDLTALPAAVVSIFGTEDAVAGDSRRGVAEQSA